MENEFIFDNLLDFDLADRITKIFIKKFFRSLIKKKKIWDYDQKILIETNEIVYPKKIPLAFFDKEGVINISQENIASLLISDSYYVIKYTRLKGLHTKPVYCVSSQELKNRLLNDIGLLGCDYSYIVDPNFKWFFEFREWGFNGNIGVIFSKLNSHKEFLQKYQFIL